MICLELTNICKKQRKVFVSHPFGWARWLELVVMNDFGLADTNCSFSRDWVFWQPIPRCWTLRCAFRVLVRYGCDLDFALCVGFCQDNHRVPSDVALAVVSEIVRVINSLRILTEQLGRG